MILHLIMPRPDPLKGQSQRRIKMRKGQQQIRCSSDVSIAGRTDSRPQTQALPPQKTRGPRGQQQDQVPEMGKSGEDVAVHPPLGGDIGRPPQGKDVLHPLHADVVPPLPHDAADHPLLLLDAGLLPLLPAVDRRPPGDILPPSSVATALHLYHHRRGSSRIHPQNALLQGSKDVPPGPLNAEALLLRGDAHLPPPHPHPDTGGAPCCLLSGQAGTHDHLWEQPGDSLHPLRTAVALSGVPPVLRDVLTPPVHLHLTSGDSSPLHTVVNSSAECPAHQSHATTRDCLRAPSL